MIPIHPDIARGARPEIQSAFQESDRLTRIHNIKVWAILCMILMPAGSCLEFFVYPHQVVPFLELRLLSSLVSVAFWLLVRTAAGIRYYRVLGLLLPFVPTLAICWFIYRTEGADSPYYAGLNLVLLAVGLLFQWTYVENLVVGLGVIGVYIVACFMHGSIAHYGLFFNNLYFLLATAFIMVTVSYFEAQRRFREFLLRYELDKNRKTLEATNRKLIEVDQAKGRFFANISHELRTPLTLLVAPLETLLRDPASAATDQGREMLRTMDYNAMRLLKLINDLLDLVRLEEGRMTFHRSETDLSDFLTGLAHTLSRAAQESRIDIRCRAPYDLGRRWVDRDKLERIILNLLFNALKFTPAGGRVVLSARMEDDRLVVDVEDNGIGISQENLPHIFDRFWQADDSARRKRGGTGIGLSLVKEMVETQGGQVAVQSQVDKGTRFTITLPTPAAPPPEDAAVLTPADERAAADCQPDWLVRLYRRAELSPSLGTHNLPEDDGEATSDRNQPRVLVVDDEPDMRRFLKSQLAQRFKVLEAANGQEGLDKARQYAPDAVLLDMMMPEKDGLQVLAELRADKKTHALPVVLLTARADEETKIKALGAGADDFLTKPFSVTELHLKVQNLTHSRELSKTLQRQNLRLEAAMEELKDTESQLVQSEKLNALGQMSAGLIHEINNPLNYALSAVHLLKESRDMLPEGERSSFQDRLSDVEDGLRRVSSLISDLRGFTHQNPEKMETVAVASCVRMALRFFSHRIGQDASVNLEVPPDFTVEGNTNRLIQVLVNLIQNSIDAHRQSGRGPLTLSFRSGTGPKGSFLSVEDNGPGIPGSLRATVFEPFFTTKDVGQGLGLGLSICHRLMEGMGGTISLDPEPGHGARFFLCWPAAVKAPGQEALHASAL